MKRILFQTLLLILGVFLTACGPKGIWNYLAMGSELQEFGTKFPEGYAAYIEKNQRVTVELDYYTGYSPTWILSQMEENQTLIDLITNAEIITFDWDPNSIKGEYAFLQGTCGGTDNQDCLRADYQKTKEDWVSMLDKIIALRNGDTSGMRQIILGSWPYAVHYPDVTSDQMSVMVSYFRDFSSFLIAEADKRGIECVKVFDGEYLHEKPPPAEWVSGLGLTEAGDKVIVDALKKIEFEK